MAELDPQLAILLEARTAKLEKDFNRARKIQNTAMGDMEGRAKQTSKRIESNMSGAATRVGGAFKKMGAGLLAGLAAGGIAGILSKIGDVAKGVAEIGDAAARAGLSTTAFQELGYVAKANRIEVDSLADGMKELSLRADEWIQTGGGSAAESFKRLGFSAAELKTKLQDPSKLFTEIIGKLSQLDKAAQIRIADELFGGNGGEKFVQLIGQGADGIRDTIQEAHNLGAIIDSDVIARAAELDQKFNAVSVTVGTALKTAIVEAATELQKFIDSFYAFEDRTTGTLKNRFNELQTRRQQLQKQQGTGEDYALSFIGKDAATEMKAVQAEMDQVAAELRKRATPQLRAGLAAQKAAETPYVPPVTTKPKAGGGAGSTAKTERDAVAELIAELENEVRQIGMTDVERAKSNALRKAGADATQTEKDRITGLVQTLYDETEARDRQQDAMERVNDLEKDFAGGIAHDLMNGVKPIDALANAFSRLADTMMNELLDAIFSVKKAGQGSGGGILSSILGLFGGGMFPGGFGFASAGGFASMLGLAEGGRVSGPGTSTSDSIPTMLSDGEYVVNAASARKYGALLEAINSGRIGYMAQGGSVGRAPAIPRLLSAANSNAPQIAISAPITVNGSAGTPAENQDLAEKMGRVMEGKLRGLISDEMRRSSRPGGLANNRAR